MDKFINNFSPQDSQETKVYNFVKENKKNIETMIKNFKVVEKDLMKKIEVEKYYFKNLTRYILNLKYQLLISNLKGHNKYESLNIINPIFDLQDERYIHREVEKYIISDKLIDEYSNIISLIKELSYFLNVTQEVGGPFRINLENGRYKLENIMKQEDNKFITVNQKTKEYEINVSVLNELNGQNKIIRDYHFKFMKAKGRNIVTNNIIVELLNLLEINNKIIYNKLFYLNAALDKVLKENKELSRFVNGISELQQTLIKLANVEAYFKYEAIGIGFQAIKDIGQRIFVSLGWMEKKNEAIKTDQLFERNRGGQKW